MNPIRYTETTDLSASADLSAQALRIDLSRHVTLRFRLNLGSTEDVEALRYARRAMIREERTRGLEWDEPSMEHPTFTPTEIRWFVLASQAAVIADVGGVVRNPDRDGGTLRRIR